LLFPGPDSAAAGPALPTVNFENIKHDKNWSQQGSQREARGFIENKEGEEENRETKLESEREHMMNSDS
jgi:hypothetical protein